MIDLWLISGDAFLQFAAANIFQHQLFFENEASCHAVTYFKGYGSNQTSCVTFAK